MKVKFEYQVTKETLRDELIATGEKHPATRYTEFDLGVFSIDQRAVIVDAAKGGAAIDLRSAQATAGKAAYGSDPTRPSSWLTEKVDLYLPDDPGPDVVFGGLEKKLAIEERELSLANVLALRAKEEREKEYQTKLALFVETWDILAPDGEHLTDDEAILKSVTISPTLDDFTPRALDSTKPIHETPLYHRFHSVTKDAIESIRKQRLEDERARWIDAHGSRRLKLSLEKGYDCQRAYVEERAAIEAPGYTVDFDDKCDWKDRFSPTEMALDALSEAEALGIGKAKIVWLTQFFYDPDNDDYFDEPGEAIVIREYLGKYDLVNPL